MYRRLLKISWMDRGSNNRVLNSMEKDLKIIKTIKQNIVVVGRCASGNQAKLALQVDGS